MGILFTGPMGTGKTFVAEAFAKECGLTTDQAQELPLQVGGRDRGEPGEDPGGHPGDRPGHRHHRRGRPRLRQHRRRGRRRHLVARDRPHQGVHVGHVEPRPRAVHPDDQPARQARHRHQARRPARPEDPVPLPADRPRRSSRSSRRRCASTRSQTTVDFPAIRERFSAEARRLLQRRHRGGRPARQRLRRARRRRRRRWSAPSSSIRAAADYLPSRDVELLEYMELLAVFEASNRRMLPAKYAATSARRAGCPPAAAPGHRRHETVEEALMPPIAFHGRPCGSQPFESDTRCFMVIIFGKDSCPYTMAARDDYTARGIQFEYVNVKKNPVRLAEMLKYSRRSPCRAGHRRRRHGDDWLRRRHVRGLAAAVRGSPSFPSAVLCSRRLLGPGGSV